MMRNRPGVRLFLGAALPFLCTAAGAQPPAPAAPAPAAAPAAKPAAPAPAAPAAKPAAPAPSAAAPAARPKELAPLDLPAWLFLENAEAAKTEPWILVIDDPQCPYCMQLHLAIEKARENGDAELTHAIVARLPFPLAFHDQAAHVVMDAFCLEASRAAHPWSGTAFLDWLMVEPWESEPEWKAATMEDLVKDGGLFDSHYEAHKVTSSRRREYQTDYARKEAAACAADLDAAPAAATGAPPKTAGQPAQAPPVHAPSCRGDADCEKLCATLRDCRAACPAASAPNAPRAPAPDTKEAPPSRDDCLADCSAKYAGTRYRQYSRAHSTCLLAEGPDSAHGRTAAAVAWGVDHKVPGTPTIYAGHPSVGFRLLGDSDSLVEFIGELRSALAAVRAKMPPAPARTASSGH